MAHPNFEVLHVPPGMVCSAVLSNPKWRGRYQDRVAELTKLFAPPDRLHQRLDEIHQRLRPVLTEMDGKHAEEFTGHARMVKERLAARARFLLQQNAVVSRQ